MMPARLASVLSISALCFLPGCMKTLSTDSAAPVVAQQIHENTSNAQLDRYLLPKDAPSPLSAWWSFLKDPALNELLESGLAMNQDRSLKREELNFPEAYNATQLQPYFFDSKIKFIEAITLAYMEYRYTEQRLATLREYRAGLKPYVQNDGLYKGLYDTLDRETSEHLKNLIELSDNLAQMTNLLPQYVNEVLRYKSGLPRADITPVLVAPASVIAQSPAMLLARSLFNSGVDRVMSAQTKGIFPDMMLGSFMGVPDYALAESQNNWRIELGSAIKNLDWSGLEDQFGQSSELVKLKSDTVAYLMSFERVLVSYAQMQKQQAVLSQRVDIQNKYRAQDIAEYNKNYEAKKAALQASHEELKLLITIYGLLGVY